MRPVPALPRALAGIGLAGLPYRTAPEIYSPEHSARRGGLQILIGVRRLRQRVAEE
ncbi:hypothetical protein [Leucobacter sp. GX24907]